MIDGRNIFDQTVKNNLRTYDSVGKITTGQCDNYTTVCLLVYPYSEKYFKLTAIDLSKQQKQDADPKEYNKLLLLKV